MMKKNLLFFTLFAISCIFANNKMLAATSSIKIENQQFYTPELITGVKPLANSNESKLKSKKSIKPRTEAKKSLKKWFKPKFLKTKKTTEGKNNTIYYIGFAFSSSLLILFIALKLTKVIAWSWLWVLSPLWIPAAVALVVLLIALIVLVASGV
jgi:Flp pilus assembly protein TadB